ncbi:hypothetical protein M569_03805, partial [Genlisea aurea]
SCGSCRYPLNLSSSNRVTSTIDSKYRRSISKGYFSFRSIDPSRFTQVDKLNCIPISWGVYSPKTKLLCRNCGVLIGYGYSQRPMLCGMDQTNASASSYKKIKVKIKALNPSED